MSLRSKLKHIFIISVIIASSISANTALIITTSIPPIKQAFHAAAYFDVAAASALSDHERYDSGYNHGCSDAKTEDHPYLDSSGGKSSHTAIFMQGYNEGYCKCHNPNSNSNNNNGVSDSFANGTDSEPDDDALLSKQNENINLPSLPNSTSFHA